jgi:pyruvate formate lyase activating enzyme
VPETEALQETPLEAKSPFELRVNLSRNRPESDMQRAIRTGDVGFLHSFTTGSAVDGPGIRIVAWTAGCMWRCRYCHNPDTWNMRNGMPVTLETATEEVRKYTFGLKMMSGGLTVSGGEPLWQNRFVVRLFTAAREMGVHTTLDTNGYLGERLSDDDLEVVSLVLLDLKTWNPDRHRALTGMENGPTLAFARRLAEKKKPIWVRFVLVPGLTDDVENVTDIARFSASLGIVERVDVLPFHQMGRYKWKALGMDYTLENVEPPSAEAVQTACTQFRAVGLKAY